MHCKRGVQFKAQRPRSRLVTAPAIPNPILSIAVPNRHITNRLQPDEVSIWHLMLPRMWQIRNQYKASSQPSDSGLFCPCKYRLSYVTHPFQASISYPWGNMRGIHWHAEACRRNGPTMPAGVFVGSAIFPNFTRPRLRWVGWRGWVEGDMGDNGANSLT